MDNVPPATLQPCLTRHNRSRYLPETPEVDANYLLVLIQGHRKQTSHGPFCRGTGNGGELPTSINLITGTQELSVSHLRVLMRDTESENELPTDLAAEHRKWK